MSFSDIRKTFPDRRKKAKMLLENEILKTTPSDQGDIQYTLTKSQEKPLLLKKTTAEAKNVKTSTLHSCNKFFIIIN